MQIESKELTTIGTVDSIFLNGIIYPHKTHVSDVSCEVAVYPYILNIDSFWLSVKARTETTCFYVDKKMEVMIERYMNKKKLFRPGIAKNAKYFLPKTLHDKTIPMVEDDVLTIINEWNKIHKPKTTNNKISIMRNFFKYCEGQQVSVYKAYDDIPNVREKEEIQSVAKLEDVQRILSNRKSDCEINIRKNLVLAMLWDTGVRVSELCDITLDQIDRAHKEWIDTSRPDILNIEITTKKSRKLRFISWTKEVHEQLLIPYLGFRLQKNIKSDFFILNENGKRISERTIQREIEQSFDNLGVEGITPHSLRRAFALIIYQLTRDLNTVKERMGHTSIVTTQKYLPLTKESYFTVHNQVMPKKLL